MSVYNQMKYYCAAFCLLLFLSCDSEEAAPAFLEIGGINFTTGPGQGAATEDITEVWVFADDVFLGAYDIPSRIPIIASGETDIRIQMGVRQNGISATPEIYEFYAPVTRTLDLIPGEIVDLGILDITYRDDVRFAILEDFEPGRQRVFTDILSGSGTIEASTENVLSGSASGKIELMNDDRVLEALSFAAFSDLIFNEPNVWLEVDFISDVPVVWGIVGNIPTTGLARFYGPGFLPSTEWRKIYFNLTEVIVISNLAEYSIGLNAFIQEVTQESGTVFLDNVKVLYF